MQLTDVYLGLGSNLGDRHAQLLAAIELLTQRVGRLVRCSSFIETAPWGFVSEHPFLNAVALFRTTLSPRELSHRTSNVSWDAGRRATALTPTALSTSTSSSTATPSSTSPTSRYRIP